MSLQDFELHPDRLSTLDENGKRVFVLPADVRGYFRKQRTKLQAVLILFFLFLPWIRIGGRQALLLDLANRHFEFFGLSLRAHNAPLLFFVFASLGFGLFFATAVFGRVWCGWACPQTVFIDGVFRRIERWIEGPAMARRKLQTAPWTFSKIRKRVLKWAAYVVATLVLTHSFIAIFVGTGELGKMMESSPAENKGTFIFMLFSSVIIFIVFTWFREQFCTIVCPYGRFQSVLMDKDSMVVAYDVQRGEPRATSEAKALAKANQSKLGDCVNCYRCVQVCPTGIDIRRGVQMECIACTSCIDACDEVMTKVNKPKGLIRYNTLSGEVKDRNIFRPRVLVYLTLCVGAVTALTVSLARVKPVEALVLRAKDAPYTTQASSDGQVIVTNHLKVELSNQSGADQDIEFTLPESLLHVGGQLIIATQPIHLLDGQVKQFDVFVRFPQKFLENGKKVAPLKIHIDKTGLTDLEKPMTLVGPFS